MIAKLGSVTPLLGANTIFEVRGKRNALSLTSKSIRGLNEKRN